MPSERYNQSKYYDFILQCNLRGAVEYLQRFPSQKRLAQKYLRVFENGEAVVRVKNAVLHKIDLAFQEYYRAVFWRGENRLDAWREMCRAFALMFGIKVPVLDTEQELDAFYYGVLEDKLEEAVTMQGYCYLGGDTAGYLGPYVWKRTIPTAYRVKLPDKTAVFTVNMLTGFISRSWMAFLSFDTIGTGGWVGKDGRLYCVKKSYKGGLLNPKFRVNYLKHEAQHAEDIKNFPGISSARLEYRAKLVELIYAANMKAFYRMLSEASSKDTRNTHAYASYCILKNLSPRILGKAEPGDAAAWRGKLSAIRREAQKLFEAYPEDFIVLENENGELIL